MSQEPSQHAKTQSPATWERLWGELRIRAPQDLRDVPDQVEGDLMTLKDIERVLSAPKLQDAAGALCAHLTTLGGQADFGERTVLGDEQRSAQARHAFTLICDRLTKYREDAEFMERHGLAGASKAAEAREALYTYLGSKRGWGEFRVFERALSPRHFDPLVERVFARDARAFLDEFANRWREERRVAEFDKFTRLAERSIEAWDLPSLRSLWTALYEGVERGAVGEESFARLGRRVVEDDRMTAPELRAILAELSRHALSNTKENGSWLAQSGKILARRTDPSALTSLEHVRSDPRVEFGFLAARIDQLSTEPITPKSQIVLVELYRRAAEHALPANQLTTHKTWRDESLGTIRGHALQSMYVRPEMYSRQIITAAMPLLRESWYGNSGVVFRELIGFGATPPRPLVLDVLRELLVADTVASALWEQCGIRSGSYFREDRRKLVGLFRDALSTEREKRTGRDALYMGRLLGLLGCLYGEARLAIPDALEIVGIRAISLGRLGFVASPWSGDKDRDPLVRAAARRFLRPWEQVLSAGIRRKLQEDESADRSESLTRYSDDTNLNE